MKPKIEVQENFQTRLEEKYQVQIADKDKIIKELKEKLSSALENDNESKKQLEEQIKEISKRSDEKDAKYKELSNEFSKLKDKSSKSSEELVPFKGSKLIHLDLKGAPPKVDYLLKLMDKMKDYGATGLLIEYEDMFPWSDELSVLASKNAYSKDDLTTILNKADDLKLTVVPLIQTFGHLEFVLKHKEFADMRAVKQVTTSICPINEKSVPFIQKLVKQVVELHPNMKWIHLGDDEVWNIKNVIDVSKENSQILTSTIVTCYLLSNMLKL